MSRPEFDPDLDRLRDLAEIAVIATLPLLPLRGSWNAGYTLTKRIDSIESTLAAEPQEWADAAQAIAELHAALSGQGSLRPQGWEDR